MDVDNAIEQINSVFDLELRCHTVAAPVQVLGTIDGYALFFRSRWSFWYFALAEHEDDAVSQENCKFIKTGSTDGEYDASWLAGEELREILSQCISEFRLKVNDLEEN